MQLSASHTAFANLFHPFRQTSFVTRLSFADSELILYLLLDVCMYTLLAMYHIKPPPRVRVPAPLQCAAAAVTPRRIIASPR